MKDTDFKYWFEFIKQTQDKNSIITSKISTFTSEGMKKIPFFGSLVERLTLGKINDEVTSDMLKALEAICEKVIREEQHNKENIEQIFTILDNLNLSDLRTSTNYNKIDINPKFRLITISGASAVGKDSVLDKIIANKKKFDIKTNFLKKFTTREQRTKYENEGYYSFKDENEFNELRNNGKILFPYLKRNHWYGFDKDDFYEKAKEEIALFAIFTDFKNFPNSVDELRRMGVKRHDRILLLGDETSLQLRSLRRNLTLDDLERRKKSISEDIKHYVENKDQLTKEFNIIIDNGDDQPINQTYNKIIKRLGF